MVLRTGTKLFLPPPGAQVGWAQWADSRNNDIMGEKVFTIQKENRKVAPVPKTYMDRTDKHQFPPAATGKDTRRRDAGWDPCLYE